MNRETLSSLGYVCCSVAVFSFAATHSIAAEPPARRWVAATAFVQNSNVTLRSAVIAARVEYKTGIPFSVGISRNHPRHAFEVLFLADDLKSVVRVELDVVCGEVLAVDNVQMPPNEVAALAVVARNRPERLEAALKQAEKLKQGTAIAAKLRERRNGPPIAAVTVIQPTGMAEILVEPVPEGMIPLVCGTP
jgi:hypothetical protein